MTTAPKPSAERSSDQEMIAAITAQGVLQSDRAQRAADAAAESGQTFATTLLELGLVTEEALAGFYADWLGLPLLTELSGCDLLETGSEWDISFLKRMQVYPCLDPDGRPTLVMANPRAVDVCNTLCFQHDVVLHKATASARTIELALDELSTESIASQSEISEAAASDLERLRSLANEGPVIRTVNAIIIAAIDQRASDIHFESQETELWVRFRIDGGLVHYQRLSDQRREAVISRLKVMARLNISERRRPQDGRIRMPVRGRDIDIRLSSLPTQHGESVVLRLLDRSRLALEWSALGFAPGISTRIKSLVHKPHGLFLVTGPTGSGKTTTLYTALSSLDAVKRKIITFEDPIEYDLPGVNQVQVDPDIGYSFAAALRATLRQDPNVIMVGEIRDLETAESAIRAALIGRMVLSTVHTNSAIGAIDRLVDLGVQKFLLASTLRGVLSQRLLPRLCDTCAAPDPEAVVLLTNLLTNQPEAIRPRRAVGCPICNHTGYVGRIICLELIEITPSLTKTVSNWGGSAGIDPSALVPEFQPLSQACLEAAARGETSVSEAYLAVEPGETGSL